MVSNTITGTDGSGAGTLKTVNGTFTYPALGKGGFYTNVATFRVINTTAGTTPLVSGGYVNVASATAYDFIGPVATASIGAIAAPTNSVLLTNFVSSAIYTNQVTYFTNQIRNTGAQDVTVQDLIATLPNGFVYAGQATNIVFGAATGVGIADPTTNGYVLSFTAGYTVAASTTNNIIFAAYATNALDGAGNLTNRAVSLKYNSYGLVGTNTIDVTYATTDNVIATNAIIVKLNPTATNVTTTATIGVALNVLASGGLTNSALEPNGQSFTFGAAAPTYGTVIVTNNTGGYTYTNFNHVVSTNATSIDVWTYYVTNTDGRVAAATVTVTNNRAAAAFSGLSSQSVVYGTNTLTVTGTVGSANVFPTNGEVVKVSINGVTNSASITAGTGAFTTTFNPATFPVNTYTVTYNYVTDDALIGVNN